MHHVLLQIGQNCDSNLGDVKGITQQPSQWKSVIFVPTEGQTTLFPGEVHADIFLIHLWLYITNSLHRYKLCNNTVLQWVQEGVWWKRPEKWWTGDRFLHHDILLLTLHFAGVYGNYGITRGAQTPRLQDVQATKYFVVVRSICEYSLWTLLHVAHLAPRILRWFLEFWKICAFMGMTFSTPFILPRWSTL
jgi:hypothetical protein